MEVRSSLRFGLIICSLFIAACSKAKDETSVFPNAKATCADQALPHRYVARWVDGHVTLESGETREQFTREFVRPNLERLELVEEDIRLALPAAPDGSVGIHAGTFVDSADNWGAQRIRADMAWTANARGAGITVAVVDSGIDLGHHQLVNQIAYNKGETGTDSLGRDKSQNGVDDDGDGLVDDYAGYDFTVNTPQPLDNNSHGSHVSGIIAAEHTDTQAGPRGYVQGVAPAAKILPLRFIDSSGSGSLYNAMRAIDYAVLRGARVINASWGGSSCSRILLDQIAGLADKNVIFVGAAGNSSANDDSADEYPSAFNLPSQLTVGAVGTFDNMADYSNYGLNTVHIFAPGTQILSTVPHDAMAAMSGTSMAAPFVSGAVAVLLSSRPHATMKEVRAALYESASKSQYYRNASQGRLDLGGALQALARILP